MRSRQKFLCFQNVPHVDHWSPVWMHLQIQLDSYEYRPWVSFIDTSSQGHSISCSQWPYSLQIATWPCCSHIYTLFTRWYILFLDEAWEAQLYLGYGKTFVYLYFKRYIWTELSSPNGVSKKRYIVHMGVFMLTPTCGNNYSWYSRFPNINRK